MTGRKGSIPHLVFALVYACILCTSARALSQEGNGYWFDHVHVSIEGGATPFLAVEYAVRAVDDEYVAIQSKQYPYVAVYDNRAVAVPKRDAVKLFDSLKEAGALELPDAGFDAPFSLTFKVEIAYAGASHSFTVTAPELLDDPRYSRIVESVIGFIEKQSGEAWFRDIIVPEEELGLLNLRTFPPAEVLLDGVPTGRKTPIGGLEIAPGLHEATLVVPELRIRKKVKFTIFKGQVTNLNLNLGK